MGLGANENLGSMRAVSYLAGVLLEWGGQAGERGLESAAQEGWRPPCPWSGILLHMVW